MSKGMRFAAVALGAALAASAVSADDTMRLDLKASKSALKSGAVASTVLEPAGRAQIEDDDLEEVNLRYWRGYVRGSWGGGYVFPRAYAFRAGYYNAGGYFPGNYIARRYYYGPSYYAYSYPTYYSTPVYYTPSYYYSPSYCYSPISGSEVIPATTLQSPAPRRMAEPEEPAYAPRVPAKPSTPAPAGEYNYDGPATPRTKAPTYRYDGDPALKVPMPSNPAPAPTPTAPKIDPADGRLVKSAPSAKKYSFQAYGDNRKTQEQDHYLVKKDKN